MLPVRDRIAFAQRLVNALGHAVAGPLQSTMNAVFILHRTLEPGKTAEATALKRVEEQLEDVRRQLERVTSLAVATRNREPQPIALGELARRAVEGDEEDVRLSIDQPDRVVLVDVTRLVAALTEIVNNAVEFSPVSGEVVLRVTVDGQRKLTAEVADRGTQAWPSPPEAAFDPTYTTKARSLGLGLAIAYAAAESLGGDVRIAKRSDGGSVVTLEVPVG